MNRLTYVFFLIFANLFRILPFRVLYLISDGLYFLMYYIIGYRKKVVFMNLRNSFPQKSGKEIAGIAKGFYTHLCDILIETMKSITIQPEAIVKRFRVINPGIIDDFYPKNKSVIMVVGHYNNWEWGGIAAETQLMHKPVGFYKTLSNGFIDNYIKRARGRDRTALVPINDSNEVFKKNWLEPAVFLMIADQSPSSTRLAHWVNFLNQDTATLHGPEKYARMYDLPVVYGGIKKIGRGHYEAFFEMLCEDPSTTRNGEITEKFMNKLEEKILEDPRYYLWSHKRWKHRRELK